MTDLASYKRKRGTVRAKLTNFSKFLLKLKSKEVVVSTDLIELDDRIISLNELKTEFNDIQSTIESMVEEGLLQDEFETRNTFDDDVYNQVSIAKDFLNKHKQTSDSSNSSHSLNVESSNTGLALRDVRLPTISLPQYDGSYSSWLEFRDVFRSLIHDNNVLSDVQKLHYLRASLQGDAALVIKCLEISSANYTIAWNALLERYDNNKLLIHNHIKALFNSESVGKESASSLRKLIDDFSKNIRSLDQLNQPVSHWDTLLVYLITSKLDSVTLREWENVKADLDDPKFENIKSFLKARADTLEMIQQNQTEKRKVSRGFLSMDNTSDSRSCIVCGGNHYVQNCEQFLNLSVLDRDKKVRMLKLCVNCLRKGHYGKMCQRGTCKRCRKKHHTLLHREQGSSKHNQSNSDAHHTEDEHKTNEGEIVLSACSSVNHVFLSTAYVKVADSEGNMHIARALLDSGAQSSFITGSLCDKLKLKRKKVNVSVKGFNNVSSNINSKCAISLDSIHTDYTCNKCFFVVDIISRSLPSVDIDISKLSIPEYINLADPTFYKAGEIDLLIGSDLFWNILSVGQVSLGKNNPILQKTKLGWVVSGPINLQTNSITCNFVHNTDVDNVQDLLMKFWEVEDLSPLSTNSDENTFCEEHFKNTTKRDNNGRFIVSIPFKDSPERLGDSLEIARKRFMSLERRLSKDKQLMDMYKAFIHEYESLGHMEKVKELEANKVTYYLPHHGVFKQDSLTSKLRVVFDGSSPTTTGLSLNNLQHSGPVIQQSLFSILLRFRQHKYVVCADINKMFRQVMLDPEQRCFQRILWREHPDEVLQTYELKTVTYGTTSASFLVIRCLIQLAEDNQDKYPEMSQIIRNDFYVDDLLSGADKLEDATEICIVVKEILKQGGFHLRKFYSNDKRVLKEEETVNEEHHVLSFANHENTKTLGITWKPHNDKLIYQIPKLKETCISKRSILSNVAQIFDPLGLLAPCIILTKIILQRLWLEKLAWDDKVPEEIGKHWQEITNQLPELNSMNITRRVICNDAVNIELHGFSDASEKAYGASIYIRSTNQDGEIYSNLLCAKSKVAPLKTITLPRLELLAALILARLVKQVKDSLRVNFDKVVLWSDSTIVLNWLKYSPNQLKTFVSNRVSEIQSLTVSDSWRHVPSKQNPSDLVSRGIKPSKLVDNSFWWNGPKFLLETETKWPKMCATNTSLPDIRKAKGFSVQTVQIYDNFICKYSDIDKLKRIVAYLFRFKYNCMAKSRILPRKIGPLELNELTHALECIVKISQNEYFSKEISKLQRNKNLKDSKILQLNPFLDNDGILRVGGRLNNSQFSFEKKHPIILSSQSHLSQLLVRHTHLKLFHAGPQHTLASVRDQYWIVGGRILVKNIVKQCIPCFRFKPNTIKPIMAALPEMRLNSRQPFEQVGVDYAGPIMIKNKVGRGNKVYKSYICLFICCVTKAVHIELVTDLTTIGFMLALKRFISRRGKPTCIYSDNGTNFLGARNMLKELGNFIKNNKDELTEATNKMDINWKFTPPFSPHFGGLWEAGIKSIKHHLRRVAKDLILTYEQLSTLLIEIEAILNSRPLSSLSDSVHDFNPLTPSHFLIGRPATSFSEPDVTDTPVNRLSMYQHLLQVKQHIWQRWSKEYVSELQQRTKWKVNCDTLRIGSLVLIKEDHQPPLKWKLGRVEDVHVGNDGVARVATIRTTDGMIKRSFSKICPLPLEV